MAQEELLENIKRTTASLNQQIAEEKARLEQELLGLKKQEKDAGDQLSVLNDLNGRIAEAQKALADVEEKITNRSELEESRSAAREQHAALKVGNELLKTQMDEIKERLDQLESAEGATCPLCGQALSAEHRKSTLKQLQAEGKEKGDHFRVNKSNIDDLTKQIADYE